MRASLMLVHQLSMNSCMLYLNNKKWNKINQSKITNLKGTKKNVPSLPNFKLTISLHVTTSLKPISLRINQFRNKLKDWTKEEKRKKGSSSSWKKASSRMTNKHIILMNLPLQLNLKDQSLLLRLITFPIGNLPCQIRMV